ncbi:MAG: InlB B-repeat-containing protein, partial [bacterium]
DFEITLELGDGIGDNSATWTFGEVLSVTPPTLAGYEFAGWYTDAVGGSLVTDTTVNTVVGDRTLYARWTLLPS